MLLTRNHFRLMVEADRDSMRLDQFLAASIEDLSRISARRIVEQGGVHVGGRRVRRCARPVQAGEVVEVYLDGLSAAPFALGDDLVIFRDKYLLAVNKPAGVETQPTPARYQGTLYAALLDYLRNPFRPLDRPALGMVQRLDRDTSGVIVFSIHPGAHRGLTQIFTARVVRKLYLALVLGRPSLSSGEFRSRLARGRAGNRVRSVETGGKEALTRYRVIEEFAGASLVEVEILTGRSHQIRAHFAEAGHPLLGDARYGGLKECCGKPILRQMLHAWRLAFAHPLTGEPLGLEAPLPGDMRRLLDELRKEITCSPILKSTRF